MNTLFNSRAAVCISLGVALFFTSCKKEVGIENGSTDSILENIEVKDEAIIGNENNNNDGVLTINGVNSFQQDVAMVDARVRSLNQNDYVREIELVNFGTDPMSHPGYGFRGSIFVDDGNGYDLVAGDMIYTSLYKLSFTPELPYNETELDYSVLSEVVVDPSFLYMDELIDLLESRGVVAVSRAGGALTITCDVTIHSTGCPADDFWSGFGCIEFSDCSVTFGW